MGADSLREIMHEFKVFFVNNGAGNKIVLV